MKKQSRPILIASCLQISLWAQASETKQEVDYVNPFIGTSNFGATHPGAQYPHSLVSVSPYNVAGHGDGLNPTEQDDAWNSRGYIHENRFLTGFSHLNLSGVGCPEFGVIQLMPTSGELELDSKNYGSPMSKEQASPGYYSVMLDKYDIKAEATSTRRTGLSRFSFPEGKANVLLNLGAGLTNETGAMVKINSATEVEGIRTVGTFCYNAEDVRPVYFVARFSQAATEFGTFKKMPAYRNVEADWVKFNDSYKPYPGYTYPMAGDNLGAYFSFDQLPEQTLEVKVGLSFVSIENARENLDAEQPGFEFQQTHQQAKQAWHKLLSRIKVKGKEEDKTLFYSALYHTLIHPSVISDVNGEYPLMGQQGKGQSDEPVYSVFSLWDTHRNLHPLLSLVYPGLQLQMARSAVNMGKNSGWLPKWELAAMETGVMVGDPGSIMLADTYLRGLTDFDSETAFELMLKAANSRQSPLRPDNADYLKLGYVPVDNEGPWDGSVSTSLEYYLADFNIAQLASALGKDDIARDFHQRSLNYRNLYDPATGMLRPKDNEGNWLSPYDPELGRNFEPAPGYIEGNAWNYRFYVPHDIPGLIELSGGESEFLNRLNATFSTNNFDMANEPDIAYPFLYNYLEGQESLTSARVKSLIAEHYTNSAGGLPGNDDAGTLSAWLVFAMMGLYPVTPGVPEYALFQPTFDEITLQLEPKDSGKTLTIKHSSSPSRDFSFNGHPLPSPFIRHSQLVKGGELQPPNPQP
ncbi:GH92 family glycosyl hydrolase [Shewanella submarina]|uniref:GH92 family glycosyl hydrolase n=1 Tax=Shewanella submarina TaxID=2016376 RepID=A0ABV7GC17_9GAMM|nr:GH92 family glycosyl hydrolase [Shewanella submarina]MCL1036817.1 GH92 family glycosyl hydrolase [Shewanella submarina]